MNMVDHYIQLVRACTGLNSLGYTAVGLLEARAPIEALFGLRRNGGD
jgi:hypothetical protein